MAAGLIPKLRKQTEPSAAIDLRGQFFPIRIENPQTSIQRRNRFVLPAAHFIPLNQVLLFHASLALQKLGSRTRQHVIKSLGIFTYAICANQTVKLAVAMSILIVHDGRCKRGHRELGDWLPVIHESNHVPETIIIHRRGGAKPKMAGNS